MKREKEFIPHWETALPELKRERLLLLEHRNVDLVPTHSHEYLELTYILRGTVEHNLDGQITALEAGDYFIVDYGSRHSYRNTDGKGFDNLDCLFLPELLDPVLKGTGSLRGVLEHYLLHFNIRALEQNPVRMVFHDSDGRILELMERMQEELAEKKAGYTEILRCYLIQLLLLTLRQLDDARPASAGQDLSAMLTEYVRLHYMEPITLSELAGKMNYSLPYLSKRFKDEMGVSFITYLQNCRVMEGCRLLSGSNRTLAEITEMVGYSDVKFFSDMIKRYTGMSPREYRKRHRGEGDAIR